MIPSENFNPVIYTGNGTSSSSSQAINTVGFRPDFTWIKIRAGQADSHSLSDSVRGVSKHLRSDTTNAEVADQHLTSFDTNGFTLRGDGGQSNNNNKTYVAWNWKLGGATPSKTYTVTVVSDGGNKYRFDGFGTSAVTLNLQEGGTYTFNYPAGHPFRFSTTANGTHGGGSEYTTGVTHVSSTQTKIVVAASAPALYYYCSVHSGMGGAVNTNGTFGSSNFNGSIISTVSANVDAGFSIATFTLPTSAQTIGHGLSKPPELVIQKGRATGSAWWTFAKPVGNTKALRLDTTTTPVTSQNFWNNTDPTSTVVTIGAGSGSNNSWLMYSFHSVEGYSKVGSYIGNGNHDGPFVYCGFKPKMVIFKNATQADDWQIQDTVRSPFNGVNSRLKPNDTAVEDTNSTWTSVDYLSNGFKQRYSDANMNGSGKTYIFIAFAENPFKHSNAR